MNNMNTIPHYVESALHEWVTIAFVSYDAYERLGRGAVGISDTDGETELLYAERDFFIRQGDDGLVRMIDAYDPEKEILVLFDTPQGNSRTLRICTPDGQRDPKRIWFFEMLRRMNEEPETLPEALPAWFMDAMTKLRNPNPPPTASQ